MTSSRGEGKEGCDEEVGESSGVRREGKDSRNDEVPTSQGERKDVQEEMRGGSTDQREPRDGREDFALGFVELR